MSLNLMVDLDLINDQQMSDEDLKLFIELSRYLTFFRKSTNNIGTIKEYRQVEIWT